MKYIFVTLLLSSPVFSKEISQYTCKIDSDLKVELSLLDKKTPSVSLVNKNSKFGLCFFETDSSSKNMDKKSVSSEGLWRLKLKKCDYYNEKLKAKIDIAPEASFKQSPGKAASFFRILKDQQPLFCLPKT